MRSRPPTRRDAGDGRISVDETGFDRQPTVLLAEHDLDTRRQVLVGGQTVGLDLDRDPLAKARQIVADQPCDLVDPEVHSLQQHLPLLNRQIAMGRGSQLALSHRRTTEQRIDVVGPVQSDLEALGAVGDVHLERDRLALDLHRLAVQGRRSPGLEDREQRPQGLRG